MRRSAVLAAAALVAGGAFVPTRAATPLPAAVDAPPASPGPDTPLASANVTYVATIPIDSPGVGGRVVRVGNQTRFYVTGLKGLSIYDVTDPALPKPLGFLAFPHAQNEDVDVSDDGTRVVISADGSLLLPVMPATVGVHVIDTTDPSNPKLLGSHGTGSHTTTCADAKCEWLYTSNGTILDARNPANITALGKRWKPTSGSAHALNRDEAGIVISDSNPRFILDPRQDPANPKVLAQGARKDSIDNSLQHNNVRVGAEQWTPRESGDTDPALRPGELLIGNSESNLNARCTNLPGGLSTWSIADFDKGVAPKQLHAYLPLNGTYGTGDPAVNALGCSGHWFTERGGIVTAAWYEHGVRFFRIGQTDGKITAIGWFQPGVTEAGAAHWVNDEYVYTVDYARGIDILRFDRTAPTPSQEEIDASWLANLGKKGAFAAAERWACSIAAREQ